MENEIWIYTFECPPPIAEDVEVDLGGCAFRDRDGEWWVSGQPVNTPVGHAIPRWRPRNATQARDIMDDIEARIDRLRRTSDAVQKYFAREAAKATLAAIDTAAAASPAASVI